MLTQEQLRKEIADSIARQNMLNQLGNRNPSLDAIMIKPRFTFIEGTPQKPIKHIASGHGRLVANGLISIANLIGCATLGGAYYLWMYGAAVGGSGVPAVPSIRLGIGTTATAYNTTQLASIISTAPNTISGSISNPSAGVYNITMTATWNAGTLGTPTITEAALYAIGNNVLQTFGASAITQSCVMMDRICSTNSDFTAFEVNASNPLTLDYTIEVAYQ